MFYFFYGKGGKRANLSPDGELLPTPIETRNTRGVKVRYQPLGIGGSGYGARLRYPHTLGETKPKRCFTPVLCRVEAWLSHVVFFVRG